jgi:predicted Zn-dependent protease
MADSPRLQKIRTLLADDPTDPFLLYGLGMEHVSIGNEKDAELTFQSLVAEHPAYVPTYLMFAQLLHRLGREPEAATILRQGMSAAKQSGDEHAFGELQAMLALVE